MSEKLPAARVTHRYHASAEAVFDAWLDTTMLGKWMFGPCVREEEIVRLNLDPRPEGAFSFLVRRSGTEIDHVGRYLEIDRPHRLVFTWGIAPDSGDDSRVTVELRHVDKGVELALTHEMSPAWAEYVPQTEAAWTKMLEALERKVG